jgi:hypothetical protein
LQLYVPLMLINNKYHPLKSLFLCTSLILFCFLPSAFAQTYYPITSKSNSSSSVSTNAAIKQPDLIDTSYFLLNYYLSDFYAHRDSYKSGQTQLINSYYTYPTDTGRITKNYNCINSISIAFDSLYSDSATIQPWSLIIIAVDTIYVPIIQVNRSLQKDTLIIELTNVNSDGYPNTDNYILDTMLIDSVGINNIGNASNSKTLKVIKWPLNNYRLLGSSKFAVNITYYDHTKSDSCWIVYGYPYFTKTCPYEGNDSILALSTNFSTISANPKDFQANSFAQWNEYYGLGYFPSSQGNNVFYPCVAADTNSYHPGTDGANYLQDIDIYAGITLVQNTGINSINSSVLNAGQNYPNPFTATSTISYYLTQLSDLTFNIYDLTGRELFHKDYSQIVPGQHSILLNAFDFEPGVYFYRLISSGSTITKKMVVY